MNSLLIPTEDRVENKRIEHSQQAALVSDSAGESISIDLNPPADRTEGRWIKPHLNPGKQYGIVFISTLAAVLLRISLDSFLGDHLAYVTFIAAVMIVTWYGGVGASLTAVIVGTLLTNWFFIHPRYEFSLTGPVDLAGMAVYGTVCFALVGFIQTWGWAWEKTEEMAEQLRYEMNRRKETEEGLTHATSTEDTPPSPREP